MGSFQGLLTGLLIALTLAPAPMQARGQANLRNVLAAMHAGTWQQQRAAFDDLLALGGPRTDPAAAITKVVKDNPRDADAISQAVIGNLERANAIQRQYARDGKQFPNETFGDYVATLIWAVGALHDPSAVPALLAQINSGAGATEALAGLRGASLPALLRMAATSGSRGSDAWLTRCSALAALAEMAEPNNRMHLDARSSGELRNILVQASQDADRATRVNAIRGLGALADPTLIPLLGRISRAYPNSRDDVNLAIKQIELGAGPGN